MKLLASLTNNRGGTKRTSDDTRILVELTYKNKILGTVGLYAIENRPDGSDSGYRVVWNKYPTTGGRQVTLLEVEKGT
ncbi:MAG: hypothetical protein ACYDAK_13255 [Candidatus Limnocylindrales bacterium]